MTIPVRIVLEGRSQWPRCLRRSSSVARLLRFRGSNHTVRMGIFSVLCCQVEFSATSLKLVQRNPTDCCALLYVINNLVNLETIVQWKFKSKI
jgi:hypothetical protein